MSAVRRATLVGVVILGGCGEGSTGLDAVASVSVSPTAVTLAAGHTVSLAAMPLDGQGTPLADRTVSWESDDPSVASVDASGVVAGVAPGSATITATSEGGSGTAGVTVLPPAVASVDVLPTQVSLLPGETVQLSATARDAQGNVLTGRTISWLSNDISVATVDGAGLVTSLSPGEATVFATAEGRSGESTVDVDDPNAARILSVVPAEIVEGQPAIINGTHFSTIAAENVVTVDGVRATVTGATDTTLDVIVPALDCRPRHLADVAVTVAGNTDRVDHPARPGAFLQLAQGEFALLQDPTVYCLQFDENTPDEEYLIGVQSTSENPTSLLSAQVVSETEPGAAPAQVRPQFPPSEARDGPSPAPLDAAVVRRLEWRAREADFMHWEIEMARLLPRSEPLGAPLLIDPPIPGNVTVGTPITLRYPDLGGNTCSEYVEIQGTVRYVGAGGIWVSDDANPVNGYTDADYRILGDQFEADIYPAQTGYFGLPADEDGNSRIVMVVTKEVNADRISGIVPTGNLFPRTTCASSNEGEYSFMFAPDPLGEYSFGPFSAADALDLASLTIGHELVHIIHLSRRFASGLGFWESWMWEGQATLGEEVLGHALNGRGPGQNFGWSVVRNVPETADRAWYLDSFRQLFRYYGWGGLDGDETTGPGVRRANAPEGCTWLDTPEGANAGVCAKRGQLVFGVTWSFLRWLSDHFGGTFAGGEAEMHTAWIDHPLSGFASLEAIVGEPIETLLAQWAASLYLDDRVSGLEPRLTLPSYDLFDIENAVVPEAHLEPRARAFSNFTQTVQVRGGSTAYFLVSGADRPATAVKVRSPSGGFLSPTIQVWVVRVR